MKTIPVSDISVTRHKLTQTGLKAMLRQIMTLYGAQHIEPDAEDLQLQKASPAAIPVRPRLQFTKNHKNWTRDKCGLSD